MRCLLPLSLLLLAGCGQPDAPPPAAPARAEERPPAPPPALPGLGGDAEWKGLLVRITGVYVLENRGHAMARMAILNPTAVAVDWPTACGRPRSMSATDAAGHIHPADLGESAHSVRAYGPERRIAAAGGRSDDVWDFAAPPRGCGAIVFRLRMPDGAVLAWQVREEDMARRP